LNIWPLDNKNFNRKNIYNISIAGNYKPLQNEIAVNKNVERIGLVSTPFGGTSSTCIIKKENIGENALPIIMQLMRILSRI
jgi:putative ABC transport system permease protein